MTDNLENIETAKPAPVPKKRGRPRKAVGAVPASKKAAVSRARKTTGTAGAITKVVAPTKNDVEKPASQLAYIFAIGRRKRAVARVFVHKNGKGEIEINGKPLEQYFETAELRNSALQALQHSSFRNSVRISVQLRGGGHRGQAEAINLGIARALLKMDTTLRPNFRARGFLTRDPREKERKKPGLKKARRAPQWQKR